MKTDMELQKHVMDEIAWDPELKDVANDIGVAAHDGVVTLSGIVNSYFEKITAEKAAQRVEGVKVVAVDLEVKSPQSLIKSDTEIAEAIKNALKWHSAVNDDQIEVKVDNGWVYLDGTVEWAYMKTAAENAIEGLLGVKGVTDRISVKAKTMDPIEVKRRINAAFHRSATIDSANVHVEVSGSRIILSGKVRTWTERNDAENAAWKSAGVVAVENRIEIDAGILVA